MNSRAIENQTSVLVVVGFWSDIGLLQQQRGVRRLFSGHVVCVRQREEHVSIVYYVL